MHLEVNFDLASLCLLTLFLVLTRKKLTLPTLPNRRFRQVCLLALGLNLLDLLAAVLTGLSGAALRLPVHLLLGACCLAQPLLFALLTDYCAYTARLPAPWLRRVERFGAALTLPVMLLGLLSPFFGFYYFLPAQGDPIPGPLCWLPLLQAALLLLCCGAILLLRAPQMRPRRQQYLLVMTGFLLAAVLLCALQLPRARLVYFLIALGLLAAYLSGQSPEYYIHEGTGAFNHRALDELLQENYHRGLRYMLVFLHTALPGDSRFVFDTDFEMQVFSSAAQRICEAVPRTQVFFLSRPRSFVLVTTADPETVSARTERLVAHLRGGWQLDGHQVALECTALLFDGQACAAGLDEARILVENAFYLEDLPKTPSGVVWASDALVARLHRLIKVHLAVRRAVRQNQIQVVFQPIVDPQGRICAAEALARLKDPELGFVGPDEFVGAAESSGAILKLGQTVYETALRLMAENRELFRQLQYVSINLSPLQLGQPDLAPRYLKLADRYGVAPGQLAFEITESTHLSRDETLQRTLTAFHDAGAQLMIDDFGSGRSNLSRILDLPLTGTVKLDRHVMTACLARDERLMADLIGLVHDSGRLVIVEGVENELQFRRLAALGADWMQGYYFARPLELAALRQYAALFPQASGQ